MANGKSYYIKLINKEQFKHNKSVNKKYKYVLLIVCSVFIGIINGIFGGGGGMICVPVLKSLFKLEDKQAHATTILIMAIISIPTLIVYITTFSVNLLNSIMVTIGVIIGGFIGSKLLNKFSNKTINILFILIIFSAGIRLLF